MNFYEATKQAYKNGYKKGIEDFVKRLEEQAVFANFDAVRAVKFEMLKQYDKETE